MGKTSRITALGAVLLAGLIAAFAFVAANVRWGTLFSDEEGPEVVELERAKFVREVPLGDATLADVLGKKDVAAIDIRIPNHWTGRTQRDRIPVITRQLENAYGDRMPKGDLTRTRFAFYVDVDRSTLARLAYPKVFFYRIHGTWQLYADERRIYDGNTADRYVAVDLPPAKGPTTRLTFVVENRLPNMLILLDARHGLSLRSTKAALRSQRLLPIQSELPRLIATMVLLTFSLISVVLAASTARFDDLWAFAAFCGACFALIWTDSNLFFSYIQDTSDVGLIFEHEKLRVVLYDALVLAATSLTLTFFRLRGRALWGSLALAATSCAVVSARHLLTPASESIVRGQIDFAAELSLALVGMQAFVAAIGLGTLFLQWREFKRNGLDAMLVPMRRRFFEAAFYLVALGLMLLVYVDGMQSMIMISGGENALLYGLAPATALFCQICWMTSASDRFRQRMLPRLDYSDMLLEHLGKAAQERAYCGVLAVFDLAGFKAMTRLKTKGPAHLAAVEGFLARSREDLERVVASTRTVFRYKTNGDENIWAFFAKDEAQARRILEDVVVAWRAEADRLVAGWRRRFTEDLGAQADDLDRRLAASLDMHVCFCVMTDLRIDPVGDHARPDFSSDRFTLLSQAFKSTNHRRVAMYRREAESVLPRLSAGTGFQADPTDPAVGYLAWAAAEEDDAAQAPGHAA